jgi:hypothetical protein
MVIHPVASVITASILIAALLLGCGASPRENFYTIPTDRTSIRPFNGSSTADRTVIGPITLPGLVDRRQFVVRVGPNQVAIAEQHCWAEPLKSQISRVIAQNLAQFLGATQVRTEYQNHNDDAAVTISRRRAEGSAWALRHNLSKSRTELAERLVITPSSFNHFSCASAIVQSSGTGYALRLQRQRTSRPVGDRHFRFTRKELTPCPGW